LRQDIIVSISVSVKEQAVMFVIMYGESLKSDVIVFIVDVKICLMSCHTY